MLANTWSDRNSHSGLVGTRNVEHILEGHLLFYKSKGTLTTCILAKLLSHIQLFATLWTARVSPGKNTEVGCYYLLQGIFLTQG